MRDAVQDAGITLDDVSLVLPHNVNRFSWSETARLLGLPLTRIYLENIPRMGHCFSADPFVNLATARAEGATTPGDTVLLASAGQGGTFAAAVVRTGEDHG
nr:3-oxoacyl-[acyl-carrier-protein] synthase III C-terminal domain-containing protein [Kutzneria chonburiensis]